MEPKHDANRPDDRPMHATPGEPEDNETAAAYANRVGQRDVTSLRPGRSAHGSGGSSESAGADQPAAAPSANASSGEGSSGTVRQRVDPATQASIDAGIAPVATETGGEHDVPGNSIGR